MDLYYYPLSRYSQKVLIALFEKQVAFNANFTDLRDPQIRQDFYRHYPYCKLPLLITPEGRALPESSIIIEYLDNRCVSANPLIPLHHQQELQVRLFDRMIDTDLNDRLFALDKQTELPGGGDQLQQRRLENQLQQFLFLLEQQLMPEQEWLCGGHLTLADCALLPCLRHPWLASQLSQLPRLDSYCHRAAMRASWMLVQDEIAQAEGNDFAGLNQIP
ncbi:glutathione S-transferase [Shewanella sp. NFH-SH190041]|uniref:glutathione S-transferase family protein n=1 Tax=Shewanella sp. NFH-SH190041 TaxID=2950245 RepID=UPI0021C3947B|nr:glutathione S-transferase family protein [Shewanella sp. NFH-SH190041]BDM62807.1 glutathione S-transferase [Shewanella sp. NFH-SH190041]